MHRAELTLFYHFTQTHPEAVARLTEQLNDADLFGLFEKLSEESLAGVFSLLLPHVQVKLIDHLDTKRLESLCEVWSDNDLATLFKHCGKDVQNKLMGMLNGKRHSQVKALVNYSDTSVGAWMTPGGTQVSIDYSCQQAYRSAARRLPSISLSQGWVFIVDRKRQLQGRVRLERLFAERQKKTSISSIMEPINAELNAHFSVNKAIRYSGWQVNTWLPIVDYQQRLVGILTYQQLQRAHDVLSHRQDAAGNPTSSIEWSNWYGTNLLKLAQQLSRTLIGR